MAREQRKLAAIVAADVALRQEVVDQAIASHGGRIVKTTGDGLLLEFPSVVNAVRCAVEVQRRWLTAPLRSPSLPTQVFLALGQTEAGHGVVVFVKERFLVPFQRGLVILALEVKITDLDIFRRF